jgi:hypothetical protein
MALAALKPCSSPGGASQGQKPGFRVVMLLPLPRNEGKPCGKPGALPAGKPENALGLDAHGGGGNAFGCLPLHERLSAVDAALEHVRGPGPGEDGAPKPAQGAAAGVAKEKPLNMFGQCMLRGYSPLLDGAPVPEGDKKS